MKVSGTGTSTIAAAFLALSTFLPSSAALAVPIMVTLEDATNGGGFFADLKITDTTANTVNVAIDISDPVNTGLTKGDILALFFDVVTGFDASTLSTSNFTPSGLGISGDVTVLTSASSPDGSSTLGGNNNLNGSGVLFDVGIETGKNGGGQGFNQTIMFDLMGTGLSTASFETDFGVRVQSISGAAFFAGGSSKLTGNSTPSTVPTPGTLALLGAGVIGISFARRRGGNLLA